MAVEIHPKMGSIIGHRKAYSSFIYRPKCTLFTPKNVAKPVFDFSWNDLPREQRFLSCMALSVYEVICMACLSPSWFVYSWGVKKETSASRVEMTVIHRRNWKQWLHVCKILGGKKSRYSLCENGE